MKNVPSISNSELEIMKIIWKKNPISSDEIILSLSDKIDWSAQTIKTFINRLLKKKAIDYDKSGRNYMYYPLVSKKDFIKSENQSFLERIYNGAVNMLFLNFLEEEDLTEDEIEKLQNLLENKKKLIHSKYKRK